MHGIILTRPGVLVDPPTVPLTRILSIASSVTYMYKLIILRLPLSVNKQLRTRGMLMTYNIIIMQHGWPGARGLHAH